MSYIQTTHMKNTFLFLALMLTVITHGQSQQEEAEVKKVVLDFFDAFHQQDSVALRNLVHPSIKMQSIGKGREGKTKVSTSSYGDFLKSIAGIPSTTKFEEMLHSFKVQIDGPLAQVITPYSFVVNGQLSHCGVNSFTMVKEVDEWKIVYLIDTRKREGCDPL
ncbi:nuclear transport factor 2 family protein [Antarcticibacterium sp. 1MA-6-2]|uniref:nuclear transport factor 2 family protein n=1 Tax=Antarcticibacterium sp. 1MA-6-2 TaxID=2908210 RepID=UPI001F1D93B6|nr:nuclear transport factor 2 family protein [Antarcticibacterium sp. 1MA-6-2]UJH91250.1 nuclear transport factor 2 family protein [Antarcticibacterium sp. 1MA-6-2]